MSRATVEAPRSSADLAEAIAHNDAQRADLESQRAELETSLSRWKRQRGVHIAAGTDATALSREIHESADELDGLEAALAVLTEQRAALAKELAAARACEAADAKREAIAAHAALLAEAERVVADFLTRFAHIDQRLTAAAKAVNHAESQAGGFVGQGAVSDAWRQRPALAELLGAVRHYQQGV